MSDTTRVFDKIFTLPLQIRNVANVQQFFQYEVKEVSDATVKAISISYYFTTAGQVNQCYLTVVNNRFEQLLYNYPLVDLQDTTDPSLAPFVITTRLRLFNLQNISLKHSYIITNDVGIPSPLLDCKLNFYY